MNCEQAEELLGAYAVDALDAADAAAFRAHIASCAEHARAAAELRAVAARLPDLADEREAPPALRSRLLDAIAVTPQDVALSSDRPSLRAVGIDAARDATPQVPLQTSGRRSWRPFGPQGRSFSGVAWGGIAAAVIIAFAGLLTWNFVLLNRLDDNDAQRLASNASAVVRLEGNVPNASASFIYFDDDKRGVLVASGIPELGDDQTYQMWVISEDGTESLGTMTADDRGHVSAVVPYDASEDSGVAITIEPAGGSPAPTTPPVFAADL